MAQPKKSTGRGSSNPTKKSGRASSTPGANPNITRLQKLVRILESSTLTELEYEDEDIVVRLSRMGTPAAPTAVMPTGPAAIVSGPVTQDLPLTPVDVDAPDDDSVVMKSPFVGTFYTAPSPDDPPFVEVGQDVSKGQTLCIIEAMKLMNEIESEISGTVVEALAENGKAVQYGQALFRIAPKK